MREIREAGGNVGGRGKTDRQEKEKNIQTERRRKEEQQQHTSQLNIVYLLFVLSRNDIAVSTYKIKVWNYM